MAFLSICVSLLTQMKAIFVATPHRFCADYKLLFSIVKLELCTYDSMVYIIAANQIKYPDNPVQCSCFLQSLSVLITI